MRKQDSGATMLLADPQVAGTTLASRIDAVTLLTGYLFLLMAIPSSLVVGAFGAAGTPASLFAAVLLCWYLAARQHPALHLARKPQPVRAAAVLFGCSMIAAYVSANRIAMPGLQENAADRGLILVAGWIGVVLLAADGIDRVERMRTLLRRIVLGATAMAVLGIAEFFTGLQLAKYITIPGLSVSSALTDLGSRDGLVRVSSTAAHPLELAAVLVMSLPLAIHQARFAPPDLRKRRWLQVILIAGAMPMTVSRSAIFGLAVVCAVLLPTWPRRQRRRAYLILLTAPAMIWLALPGLMSGLGGLFGQLGTDYSSKSRAGAFAAAGPYLAHHPWFGQGFQTFLPQTYFFVDDQYLISLIETGVVGLAALITVFATGWLTARSARLIAPDAQAGDLAQSLAASVAAAAACFATFDTLSFSIAAGLCFLLLGCVGAAWRLARA